MENGVSKLKLNIGQPSLFRQYLPVIIVTASSAIIAFALYKLLKGSSKCIVLKINKVEIKDEESDKKESTTRNSGRDELVGLNEESCLVCHVSWLTKSDRLTRRGLSMGVVELNVLALLVMKS